MYNVCMITDISYYLTPPYLPQTNTYAHIHIHILNGDWSYGEFKLNKWQTVEDPNRLIYSRVEYLSCLCE